MRRVLLAVVVLLIPALAVAAVPEHRPIPGGVAVLDLGAAEGSEPPPATFAGQPALVIDHQGRWTAVVGIGLGADAGEATLRVAGEPVSFAIEPHDYAEQRITLENEEQVSPGEETLRRIRRDHAEIRAARATRSAPAPEALRMTLPVEGWYTSPFGLRRFFNDQPRNPHSGVDIANEAGTPIIAPAAGEVVETGDYFFNGRTVFLDHGGGVISMLCHLERIDVAPGDTVARGEAIGTVGSTGRSTGPHLHWSVYLNRQAVDPMLFVPGQDGSEEEARRR